MSTITTIQATDLISASRSVINTNFSNLNTDKPDYSTGTTATTFTFNGSGGTSSSVTMRLQKIGDWVTLFIPGATATSGTGSTQFISNTAVDAAFRPVSGIARQTFLTVIESGGGTVNPGLLVMGLNGRITIFKDGLGQAWTNSATCGFDAPLIVTYYVGTGS